MSYAGTTHPAFRRVAYLFGRLVGRGPGGGALVVRLRGETVVNVYAGTADRLGRRPWTPQTLGLSFSTTKGVASTVIHRLADRGLIDYDAPVATYWPEFAAGGKERVTVRHVLTHRAGLHSVRAVAHTAEDMLDHELMEARLAAQATQAPTLRSAYHAVTYGWIVSGIARRVTGKGMTDLFREEVAEPLGLSGLHIGIKPGEDLPVADPIGTALRHAELATRVSSRLWTRFGIPRQTLGALLAPGFHRLFEGERAPIWAAQMPGVSGAFTAEALARMYGALANHGADERGRRLLSPERVDELQRIQLRGADGVLGIPMRWRLGYHHAFGTGPPAPRAFGHYGYGGSGGWADPASGLSVGFVTNRIGSVSTPLGDLNLPRLNGAIRTAAAEMRIRRAA